MQRDYSTYLHNRWTLKFFKKNASYSIPYRKRWKWPFIDIFLLRSEDKEKKWFR